MVKFIETKLSPANIYLFKVSNRNTRKTCEICSNMISDLVLVFLSLTIFHTFSSNSIVDFEEVINVSWEWSFLKYLKERIFYGRNSCGGYYGRIHFREFSALSQNLNHKRKFRKNSFLLDCYNRLHDLKKLKT